MSEFREDLLVSSIDKKRVVKIIVVAVLLITAFAFSIILSSIIFDRQRPYPSDQLSEAEEETGITLTLPPFPYNLSDFQDMNLTQDQLDSLLDALQDMFDGDIDDLDLGNFSQSQLALMASEIEVFRVFNYADFNSMSNKLWKYECFDDYTGDGWQSTAASQIYDFYTYGDHATYHWDKEILRIKTPLTPSIGINSMVIPSLFHTPFIMEGSIWDNFGNIDWANPPVLYKDDFNSSTLDVYFNTDVDVNMSYDLFGLNIPSNDQINSSAIHASYTPLPIQNKFLQLPPTVQAYLSNNPFVYTHYLALNNTILPNDNAFMVANKIRNYLQFYFSLPADPDTYTSAPPGRDTVDYFCETQEGMWVEFASAFVIFARIFGVSSRFVDGFNSIGIQEIWDNQDFQNTFAIKYKNIYNWAEIFIPTDISGAGDWVQMDVLLDSYGVGGNPWTDPWSSTNYSLIVNSNFTTGYRNNQYANITATLTLNSIPVQNSTITFTDHPDYRIPSNVIGQDPTDLNGQASILIPIDDAQTAGFHVISAIYNSQTINSTTYFVFGDVDVDLSSVSPQEVNTSESTQTNIQGYVIDPLTNQKVVGATVKFLLLNKGTNTRASATPFDIPQVETDSNGDFNVILNVNSSLSGQYDIRVDFNGTFYGGWPIAAGIMNSSSNIMDFNVTKGQIKKVWFFINDFPSNIATAPTPTRYTSITLKAYVLNETNAPLANQNVEFYDYRTSSLITSNTTNVQGYATYDYVVGTQAISGPNLLYAKLGTVYNYSYYVLDDAPTIHIFSGPTPLVINRTGGGETLFNIVGQITDTLDGSKPLGYSTITLKLFRGGYDNSSYLVAQDSYPYQTGSLGMFDLTFGVASNTPTGNYTLRMDFDGAIDLSSYLDYPYIFNLPFLSNSTTLDYELQVTAPDTLKFDFWVDGFTSNDYNQPSINRNGQVNLSTYLEWGATPIGNGETVEFYDETQGLSIGLASTTNGRASLIYSTGGLTIAGPHLISARWGSNYNYSYFILNDQINVTLLSGPTPREIYRSGAIQRTFNLQGTITDGSNGSPIKFPEIRVVLLDGTMTDVSHYLSSSYFQLDDTGAFDLTISVSSGTPANNYTLRVEFNGVFMYSLPNNQYNEYDFYLFTTNFTDYKSGYFELKVIDPDDVSIWFSVDGNPTLSFYNNFNLPERYTPGEMINFSVYITQSGTPVTTGTVVLRDVYIGSQIGSHDYIPINNGYHEFSIDTTLWHAGLHQIEVQWSTYPTFNSTYIIINKTITLSAYSTLHSIQRDVDMFSVFGSVQDGTTNLRGLNIKILLFNSNNVDVSLLYLDLAGSQTINVYDGSYQFDVNFISINCPQGDYYFRIDFNGSINEAGISLSNYMINTSSMIIPVNITAGTYIIGNFETSFEEGFYEGDYVQAYGYLYWDNGSLITGTMTITITLL
ncbi:MAG: transglutaminase domain-containing protein [Promethearchaeota archaeon]